MVYYLAVFILAADIILALSLGPSAAVHSQAKAAPPSAAAPIDYCAKNVFSEPEEVWRLRCQIQILDRERIAQAETLTQMQVELAIDKVKIDAAEKALDRYMGPPPGSRPKPLPGVRK